MFDYDKIYIEEHKIDPDNFDIDANTNNDNSDENNAHGVNDNMIDNTKIRKCENTKIPLTQSNFVDCGETIKEENIKEEIKEVESVEDPLNIPQRIENSNICEDIKEEVNEEESNSVEKNGHGVNYGNMDEEVNDAKDYNGENVNEVDGNVVGEGNINYQELENLSVAEALAFFSS